MKRVTIGLIVVACMMGLEARAQRYLISFHRPNAVLIVDADGTIQWKAEPKLDHPQDCSVTAAGNILCSDYTGVQAIGLDNKVKWRYRVPKGTQNPLALPLAEDRFLVGVEGPTLLREINREGDVLKEVKVSTSYPKVHGQFRVCRKTETGTYLVPFTLEGAVREYDGDGQVVRDFGSYKLPVGALRLPNGNTLISYYDGIVEVTPNGKTVWDFMTKRDCTFPFAAMVGIAKLKNGNTLAAFYSKAPKVPTLIEIAPDKTVVRAVKVKGHDSVGHFQLLTDDNKPSPDVMVR